MSDDRIKIYVWPDDDWCYPDQLQEYQWKSDDYAVVFVDPEADSEEIEAHVHAVNHR